VIANHQNIQRGRLAITESEQCTFNDDLLRVEELVTGVVGQEHDEARETVGAYVGGYEGKGELCRVT